MVNRKEEYLSSCVIFDTETTGLDCSKAEVIEFGMATYSNGDWERTSELYKPIIMPIQPEISAITHIVDEMVDGRPHFKDCIETVINPVIDVVNSTNGTIVAHNVAYDKPVMLKYEGIRPVKSDWLCTMRMVRLLYGDDESVKQKSLAYLRYRFKLNIPKDLEHHRASSDAYITGKLLEHLVGHMEQVGMLDQSRPYKQQIEEIYAKHIFIPRMPFGKHANCLWSEIPVSYLKWAVNNLNSLNMDDPMYDPDLAYTFEVVMNDLLDKGEL